MDHELTLDTLVALGAGFAILGVGWYALPVRFRVRERVVECRIPTWSGVGDLLEGPAEVTLVAVDEQAAGLRWLFLKGRADVVADPDWDGLTPVGDTGVGPDDLYQLLRIEPRRLELVDERQGWGFRQTVDL